MSNQMHVTAEPGKTDITITREFNAPRALVFETFTDPALVPQWWGPETTETIVEAMDVRAGGLWKYLHRSDGAEYTFFGVYHEITAPERIVNTYEFDGYPGVVGLIITTFEEKDGKTLLTEWSIYPSVDVRDAVLQSGMEQGAAVLYNRLEALIDTLK